MEPADLGKQTLPSAPPAVDGVYRAEALALRIIDLSKHKPSIPLLNRMPASFWLRNCAIPWVQLGDTVAIAFGSAEAAESQRQVLTDRFGPFIPVLGPRTPDPATAATAFQNRHGAAGQYQHRA